MQRRFTNQRSSDTEFKLMMGRWTPLWINEDFNSQSTAPPFYQRVFQYCFPPLGWNLQGPSAVPRSCREALSELQVWHRILVTPCWWLSSLFFWKCYLSHLSTVLDPGFSWMPSSFIENWLIGNFRWILVLFVGHWRGHSTLWTTYQFFMGTPQTIVNLKQ